MTAEKALARLRGLVGDGSCDEYWPQVKIADIRALLDERDALLNKAAMDKRFIATEKRFTNKYIKLHREVRKERDALLERRDQVDRWLDEAEARVAELERDNRRMTHWLKHFSFCSWWHDQGHGATEAIEAALAGKAHPDDPEGGSDDK